jgi:arylsulfatase A
VPCGAAACAPWREPGPLLTRRYAQWQSIWPGVPLYENTSIIEQPVNLSTLTPRYNERALSFLEANQDQPFFLYMAYDQPHVPLFASPKFLNTSLRGLYGDAVQEVDDSIGLIMAKLRELGLEENTLVVFASDNGAWLDQKQDGGCNGMLSGEKGSAMEGGFRVPAVFYWPGKIPAGSLNMDVVSGLDLFATLSELAGVPLPGDRYLDSVSLVPLLFEQEPADSPRSSMIYYRDHYLMAARLGEFKAHFITRKYVSGGRCGREGRLVTDCCCPRLRSGFGADAPVYHDPPLLYNVDIDPGELYALNVTEYQSVLDGIVALVASHNATVQHVPSQMDPIDLTGDIAPCCDSASHPKCTCPGA